MGALTAGLASLSYAQYKVTGNVHTRKKSQEQKIEKKIVAQY
jgi:hypothetical protein